MLKLTKEIKHTLVEARQKEVADTEDDLFQIEKLFKGYSSSEMKEHFHGDLKLKTNQEILDESRLAVESSKEALAYIESLGV